MENATLFLGTFKKSDLSATASLQTCKMGKKQDKDRHQDPLQVSLLLGSKRRGKGRERRGSGGGLEGRASLGFKLEIRQEAKGSWLLGPGLCWAGLLQH